MTDTTPTPVADALQAVDQAGTEYGVPSAELLALRKLAAAVRSHGIGAELAARRLPALECAWCGKPATLDGCTVCDSTGIRKVPGQAPEADALHAAPPVPGVTEHDGQVVIAVLPGIRDLAWYVATEVRGGGGPYAVWFAAVDDAAGRLGFEPSGQPYASKARALAALVELAGIAHTAPF